MSAADDLQRIAGQLQKEIRRLANYHRRNPALPLDTSKLDALTEQVSAIAQNFQAEVTAAAQAQVTVAVNAQLTADQAAHDASTAKMATAVAALSSAATPPAAPSLTVTPTAETFPGGTAATLNLTMENGLAPFSANGLPAGITFAPAAGQAANVYALTGDGTTPAGTYDITVSDSSTPALTAPVVVTVS